MRNLLNGFLLSAEPAGEAVPEIAPIVTPYSDRTIPVLTIVFLFIGLALIITFAIVSFIAIRKRTLNWGFALITGLAAYLLFCYTGNMLLIFAFNKIPVLAAAFEKHQILYNLIMMIISLVMEWLGVYLGYKYYVSSAEKRNFQPEPGTPVFFGWAFFAGAVLVSQQMTYSLEYALVCISINQMGFDAAVTSMVQGGVAEQEAIENLLMMTEQNPFEYLMDTFTYFMKAFLQTSAAVILYGVFYGKMEKKFVWTTVATIAAYFLPSFLSLVVDMPTWAAFLINIAAGAAFTYNAYRLVKEKMPDEVRKFLEIKKKSGGFGGRGKKEPQKMPKIVMPN